MSTHILVVEDEPSLALLWHHTLYRMGYTVTLAGSVRAAVAVGRQVPVHLILVDYYLPDGYGTEILAELRDGNRPYSVLITSDPYLKLDNHADAPLVDRHLVKPVRVKTMANTILDLLNPSRRPTSA
mgnify:CR=1 FL=1